MIHELQQFLAVDLRAELYPIYLIEFHVEVIRKLVDEIKGY